MWSLEVLLKLWVIRNGRWQTATRWAEVGLNVFALGLFYRLMMDNQAILSIPFFDKLAHIIVLIIFVIVLVETAVKLYCLLTTPQPPTVQQRSRPA